LKLTVLPPTVAVFAAADNDVLPETNDVASKTEAVTCWFDAPNWRLGPGDATEHVIVGATVSTLIVPVVFVVSLLPALSTDQ
jgi:hypothetical protein